MVDDDGRRDSPSEGRPAPSLSDSDDMQVRRKSPRAAGSRAGGAFEGSDPEGRVDRQEDSAERGDSCDHEAATIGGGTVISRLEALLGYDPSNQLRK